MKLFLVSALASVVAGTPIVKCNDIQYQGIDRNGIEVFLGIPYGQDTGAEHRFKPPRPYVPKPGSVIDATKPGFACPQQLGQWNAPLTLLNVTAGSTSEDCLNLNIARPKLNSTSAVPEKGMAVMFWIHGGELGDMLPVVVRSSRTVNSALIHGRQLLGRLEHGAYASA
jgi:carboxylesterase type B